MKYALLISKPLLTYFQLSAKQLEEMERETQRMRRGMYNVPA